MFDLSVPDHNITIASYPPVKELAVALSTRFPQHRFLITFKENSI